MSTLSPEQVAIGAESTDTSATSVGQRSAESNHAEEPPTLGHALAEESVNAADEQGLSQVSHDEVEVRDVGWNSDGREHCPPIVDGLRNEELWTLIRRFNHQVFTVRRTEKALLSNLDMNIADDEEFSPDKLRAHIERLYVSVVLQLLAFWKQVVRLRSWNEPIRTGSFLSVYLVAWLSDLLAPVTVACTMVLILSPYARDVAFPSAPLAMVDSKTGGVKTPRAEELGTGDTVTGASEEREGEAAEQEANNMVKTIASLALATTAGKHEQPDVHGESMLPEPEQVAEGLSNAKDEAADDKPSPEDDETAAPISEMVWTKAKPVMHGIADMVDTWERFANALSPAPPFHRRRSRFTLAACLLPALVASFFSTPYWVVKAMGLIVGVILFGQPIITTVGAMVERTYPKWKRFVELRHTILRGIPTNAQLTITLLRIGERNKAPVPPAPTSDSAADDESDADDGADGSEDDEADTETESSADQNDDVDKRSNKSKKKSKKHAFLSLLKGTVRGGVNTALTADWAKAAAGGQHAKERKGAVDTRKDRPDIGPVRFEARYKGEEGYIYVTTAATTPALSWAPHSGTMQSAWTVLISDIEELEKAGGLGWKTKAVVGWALQREIMGGILVKTRAGDKEYHLTAIWGRDEVFNRLTAVGQQMWEIW